MNNNIGSITIATSNTATLTTTDQSFVTVSYPVLGILTTSSSLLNSVTVRDGTN